MLWLIGAGGRRDSKDESKSSRTQQTWDGLIQKRKRVDILLEGQEIANKNEGSNKARAASLINGEPSLERKEIQAFKAKTRKLAEDHARNHPASDYAFASEGSESDESHTLPQARTRREEKNGSRPQAARHTPREDREAVSEADGTTSGDDEAISKQRKGVRGKSPKHQVLAVANGRWTKGARYVTWG